MKFKIFQNCACIYTGPFNSWDRQPYQTVKGDAPIPQISTIERNIFYGDYEGVKAIEYAIGIQMT